MTAISRNYLVTAQLAPDGSGDFHGLYAMPGKDVQVAPGSFHTEREAEAAAGLALAAALNARPVLTYKNGYRRMTGPKLAVALAKTGLSPSQLATIVGTAQARVMKWIDGEEDIPVYMPVLLAGIKDGIGAEKAMDITDMHLERRQSA